MCEYPKMPLGDAPYAASGIQAFGLELSQSEYNPRLQKKQFPHEIVKGTTTRAPALTFLTSLPTSTISPMNSWPRMSPDRMVGMYPSSRWRSDPQIAVDVIFTMASRGFRISGSGTRSTRTSFLPCQTRALMHSSGFGGDHARGRSIVLRWSALPRLRGVV